MSRTARCLVLACSLIVALPHGWCCAVAGQFTKIAAGQSAVKPAVCCECQRCAKPSTHGDKPADSPPDRCPCSDRNTVLTDSAAQAQSDVELAPVAILAAPAAPLTLLRIDAEAVCVVHPPTDHLHIFKCAWRC